MFAQHKFSIVGPETEKRTPIHYYLNKSNPNFASNIIVKNSKDITQYPLLKTSRGTDTFEDRVFIEDVLKLLLGKVSKEVKKYSKEIEDYVNLLV